MMDDVKILLVLFVCQTPLQILFFSEAGVALSNACAQQVLQNYCTISSSMIDIMHETSLCE